MAAVLTSVANGVEVTESSLGGLQYIGSQSDVSVNGSDTGIIVRTPSGSIYQFTNADMGEATAVEAAQTLVAALNAGGSTPVAAYTVFRALLNQVSTGAPTITVLENTTGGTLTASYTDVGLYVIGATGLFPNAAKVFLNVQNGVPYLGDLVFMKAEVADANGITIETRDVSTSSMSRGDGLLSNSSFEILIYP